MSAPKTFEGLRTAVGKMIPDEATTWHVGFSCHAYDACTGAHHSQHISYHANIEVQVRGITLDVDASEPTPAKLLAALKRELRVAWQQANTQPRLAREPSKIIHTEVV